MSLFAGDRAPDLGHAGLRAGVSSTRGEGWVYLRSLAVVVVDDASEQGMPHNLTGLREVTLPTQQVQSLGPVGPPLVVVANEAIHRPAKMPFVQDDDVIQALGAG